MKRAEYTKLVKSLAVGKHVSSDVYLHVSALDLLPALLQEIVTDSANGYRLGNDGHNVLKLSKRAAKISLLKYPGFFEDAFPSLDESVAIDLTTGKVKARKYKSNPPILHRKETLLAPEHPEVARFRHLTEAAERAGLFASKTTIGTKRNWDRLLAEKGYRVEDHALVPIDQPAAPDVAANGNGESVARYRTAIKRHGLSVPVQTLADHGFLDGEYSFFDYGCGRGDDVRILAANQIEASGWDPNYRPDAAKRTADIVNLGFVLNVIEDPRERRRALIDAFKHAKRVLVATVMIAGRATIEQFTEYGDGVITKRNTFQKYFTQSEFRDYLTENLGTPPIAVAPGVFYVFRDELDEQLFLLQRQRMRRRRPSFFIPEDTGDDAKAHKRAVLESNKELLAEYWDRCLALGRQPKPDEFERSLAVRKLFGSYKQAFSLLLSHFGEEELERARQARADDLLVYFALRQFERRKAYALVPDAIKRDVKEYFGTYRAARAQATELLFSCGKPAVIGDACRQAQHELRIGHLDEDHSLYVLSSQINELPAVLRVYVGCATQLYGDVEAADLVKLHIHSGKVTLLLYDDFDGKAVPLLRERIKIRLRSQAIDFFDYTGEFEPQPLYLKSRFLPDDHPRSDDQRRFDDRLAATKLFDFSGFGPGRDEFESTLAANRLRVRGFQLVAASG